MTGERSWRLADIGPVRFRSWDGEVVLYLEKSGDTHHVTGVAVDIFHAALQGPIGSAALKAAVASRPEARDADLDGAINAAAEHLCAIDLLKAESDPDA
jgi:hypothetical protein